MDEKYVGYGQIITKHENWAFKLDRNYCSISSLNIREYPLFFEKHYRMMDIYEMSEVILEKVSVLFKRYNSIDSKKVKIALERLKMSSLRNNEQDALLDALIGLETLTSDNGRGSITFKLAMRTAALFKKYNIEKDALHTVKAINKIYKYRSDLVHGSINQDKRRVIEIPNGESIGAVDLSIKYLRNLILVLLENPKYLDMKKVDAEILLD